jgi:beta-lactamase class A
MPSVLPDNALIRELAQELEMHGPALTEPSIVLLTETEDLACWNGDVPYYPACMIKIPICVAAYSLAERNDVPRKRILIDEGQLTESAYESSLKAGQLADLDFLTYLALHFSDNSAANVLMDLVGRERGTELLQGLGLIHTQICRYLIGETVKPDPLATGRNRHSAADAAKLLRDISAKRLPGSDHMMMSMEHSSMHELGFFGMRPQDKLYYKDGYTSSVCHVGVIIETSPSTRYICVIYTNLPHSPDNYGKITGFLRKLRPHLP